MAITMNMFLFNMLSLEHQCTLLSKQGTMLASRSQGDRMFKLYSIYNFYVEQHIKASSATLVSVEVFKNIKRLNPYLSDIPIPF